jgi:recombination protein RecA
MTMTLHPDLLKTVADLNKALGDKVKTGSDVSNPGRITTGSLALDLVLGGGWPTGVWSEIIGEASHGKTAICLKTIAANQALDPDFTVVWIAGENWHPEWAATCGVDNSRVLVVESNIMEDAYEAAIKFCESKQVDLLVIDSLPALTPGTENEKSMDEPTVGRGALLTNKFFRKVAAAQHREPGEKQIAGILINQYRMKIGVMHGDPRTTPGGLGKDYAMAVRAEVKRDEWQEIGPSGNKRRIGQTIKMRTIKNKTYPPQQTAYVDFYMAEGGVVPAGNYDFAKEIVSLSLINGVVDRRGGWVFYGDRKWQGAANLLEAIRQEPELRKAIESEVMDTLKPVAP